LGRFLSPDSIGTNLSNPQTLNRYAYVGNNPMNRTDPTGHCGGGGPEGNDCASEPTAGGGDRGGDARWGDHTPDAGGGHDNGGQETFADLVQAVDQITPGGDPASLYAFSAPPGTGTGTGTGTGNKVVDALLALAFGSALLSNLPGGGPSSGPSSSGQGNPSIISDATELPKGRVLIQIQDQSGYYDSETVPPPGSGPIATVKQGNIAIDKLVDQLVGSTSFTRGDLQAIDDAQSRAHRYLDGCRAGGGCGPGGSISFDAYGTGYRIDIQIFAPRAFIL